MKDQQFVKTKIDKQKGFEAQYTKGGNGLPVAEVAPLVADSGGLELLVTAVDAVAIPLTDEAAETAVLPPPAAALFEPDGHVAADGNVTWTLRQSLRSQTRMQIWWCSRITELTSDLLGLFFCVSEQSSFVLAQRKDLLC